MHDVIIIGSGPAGLTAGIYAVRAGQKTRIISGSTWGGQLMQTTEVENFPGFEKGILGPQLMQQMRNQAERLGAKFIDVDFEKADFNKQPFLLEAGGKSFKAKSVIIATGASSLWLGVPGEDRLKGKGVSSCATCDAFFFRDKKVAVVGGGDSAMEESLVLSRVAEKVTIIHRRDKLRASKAMQDRVFEKKNIDIIWNKTVEEIIGRERVEAIVLKDAETGREKKLKIDGVFVAIGHKPNTEKLVGIKKDEKGFIQKKEIKDKNGLIKYSYGTSVPGVFVAGDVHDYRYRQAITAAAFGCMAALDASRWLEEQKK